MKLWLVQFLLLGLCLINAQAAESEQRILEGTNVTIPCENEGEVTWSKLADRKREIILKVPPGETPVQPKPDPRYSVLSNLTLIIKDVSVSDSGVYYCNSTAVVKLNVVPLPALSETLSDDMRGSATRLSGGLFGVERVLFISLAALFLSSLQ
ncbi:hypothetical protein C0J50_21690 [Silurus asotus]|uniref:Ig-like domain-containing protein n=1 Tax=Silurus asotus TaxID=30991 RepID=A0AAD5AM30_SILAS|nr:hypothetical protein C0J50_21690 [Silurus asotus]